MGKYSISIKMSIITNTNQYGIYFQNTNIYTHQMVSVGNTGGNFAKTEIFVSQEVWGVSLVPK